jgi:hypothetical protein
MTIAALHRGKRICSLRKVNCIIVFVGLYHAKIWVIRTARNLMVFEIYMYATEGKNPRVIDKVHSSTYS